MTLRSALYRFNSLLGDLHATERGRAPQRLVRKVIYKHAFKAASWLTRRFGVGR